LGGVVLLSTIYTIGEYHGRVGMGWVKGGPLCTVFDWCYGSSAMVLVGDRLYDEKIVKKRLTYQISCGIVNQMYTYTS
jgi:hypothetical protein